MEILKKIKEYSRAAGERTAYQMEEESLTYRELDLFSDRLASLLLRTWPGSHFPVPVYGHKHPFMLVCFLACVKAGHAYCPIDVSMPSKRVNEIIEAAEAPVVLAAGSLPESVPEEITVLSLAELKEAAFREDAEAVTESTWVSPEDTFYIIFTSGSTGKPKGVQIPYENLNHFLDWAVTLGNPPEEKQGKRFLNQAPFSFDLSVMDLYTCLASGGTLCPLDKKTQGDYRALFERIQKINPSVWVSTPSFAEICLADPKFDGKMVPELSVFLFCGERLTNTTARKLIDRFPRARVINTYGPTESTVAMTEVEITRELCEREDPLPVGRVKPGSFVKILKEDGTEAPEGESGEIVILGDTVSTGYFRQKELTDAAFFEVDAGKLRAYRTGDEGFMKNGMLMYNGRIDLQVKLHGYRIELGDIENNLLRLPQVSQACVVPSIREGKVNSLTAYVSLYGGEPAPEGEDHGKAQRRKAAELKEALRQYLPDYMIPKKISFLDKIPMTMNGKADRKKLMEETKR